MRRILLEVIVVLVLIGCSEKNGRTLESELENLSDAPQVFTISIDQADTIKAKNGTIILIGPNSFVFADGQDPQGQIQIEMKEVFDKSDMILNGLGTVSDGRLLESFGMIFLRATSNDKELRIKDNKSILVGVPNKKQGTSGELFYGVKTDSLLNWTYAGSTKDTTEVIETVTQLSNGLASIKRTTYKFKNGFREFVSDTLYTGKYKCCADSTSEAGMDALPFPSGYGFEVTKLGWINCDRFIEVVDKVVLEIELKDYSQPVGYLVFAGINSVMQILFDEKGKAAVKNLPASNLVDLIVIDKIKDKHMWGKRNVKLGVDSKLILNTGVVDLEKIKSEVKMLDK